VKPEQIQRYNQWSSDHNEDLSSIIGASRQFYHLEGVYLDPKGRWKKQENISFLKFSVRPRPLKWKGINHWDRMVVVIKKHNDDISFCVMIDGAPMNVAPNTKWSPVIKAKEIVEKATKKINRS